MKTLQNNPQLKNIQASQELYAVLTNLRNQNNDSVQLESFLTNFAEIFNNNKFNNNRKKIETERLLKRVGIKEQNIFDSFQNIALKSNDVTPNQSEAVSEVDKSELSERTNENKGRLLRRRQNPDIVDDVLEMN